MATDDHTPPPDPIEQETSTESSIPDPDRAMVPDRAVISTDGTLAGPPDDGDPSNDPAIDGPITEGFPP
jgi:hypothetical protein